MNTKAPNLNCDKIPLILNHEIATPDLAVCTVSIKTLRVRVCRSIWSHLNFRAVNWCLLVFNAYTPSLTCVEKGLEITLVDQRK